MKYLNFLLLLIVSSMFFMISCDDSNGSDTCSSENPNGKCEKADEYCKAGICLEKLKICEPACTDEQICLDGICSEFIKEVDCVDNAPDNSKSVPAKVTVTYDELKKEWSEAADCEWECITGFEKNYDKTACIESQEEDPCDNIQCGNKAVCNNGECICELGYILDEDKLNCFDINECDSNSGGCNQICTNNEGGYECSCEAGFTLGLDGKTCSDVNECSSNNGGCDDNANCNNKAGSFECVCKGGYEGDGQTCTLIEVCEDNPCTETNKTVCKDEDHNGFAECLCDNGYKLNNETGECENINECDPNHLLAICNSEASCNDTEGSYDCICNDGYEGNGVVCNDIDECETHTDNCSDNATCTNKAGNNGKFECACNEGYHGDGVDCIEECGDGVQTESEGCDDGNTTDGDGCSAGCIVEFCGDGIINNNGEDCDDGGESVTCNTDCTTASCGDGKLNITASEACDDGNTTDGDGCSAGCVVEFCGDGIINNNGEGCDDGNTTDGDGCSAGCVVESGYTCSTVGQPCVDNCIANNVVCDDNNICTDDSCSKGVCSNVNNTAPCDDAIMCTDNDVCSDGSCSGDLNSSYELIGGVCTDIDECANDTDGCDVNNYCENTEGSFNCIPCNCTIANTVGNLDTCTDEIGQCDCKEAYSGITCDVNRTVLWGDSGSDFGHSVVIDSNNNVFVTGYTSSDLDGSTNAGGFYDIFLTKFDSSGVKQWTKQWGTVGNDVGQSVAIDSNDNIFVTGSTDGALDGNTNTGNYDIFLTKFNNSGTKQWTKQWGTADDDIVQSVVINSNNNIFITGYTYGDLDGNTNTGNSDIFLTKLNNNGTKQWTKQWGTADSDTGHSATVDSNNNIFVTGYTNGDLDGNTNTGAYDIFLTKFDSSGVKQWTKQWGATGNDVGYSVAIDSNDNVFVTGYTYGDLDGNTNAGSVDIFLTKFDSSGVKQWTKQWGSSGSESGNSVTIDSNNNIFVTGYTYGDLDGNTNAGSSDIFLTKFDSSGVKQWIKQWGTADSDTGHSATVDSSNNVFVTGNTYGDLDGNTNAGSSDIFLTKFKE